MTGEPRVSAGGLVLLVVLAAAWGLNWPIMKVALGEIPPWTFRTGSGLVGAAALLAWAAAAGKRLRPAPGELRQLAIAALFTVTLWNMLVAFGLTRIGAGHGSVLGYTMPLWATLIGVTVLRETLTWRRGLAMALGLAGILALLARDQAAAGLTPLGAGLALGAAIAWAIGTLYQQRRRWTVSTLGVAGWQLLLGTLPIALLTPVFEDVALAPVSARAWLAAGFVTLIAIVLGFYWWFRVIELLPRNVAVFGTLLMPLFALAGGVAMWDEPFGWREAVAVTCVVCAIALVSLTPRAAAR